MIDSQWRDVKRVLAVRLDNLGDVLVTTPAIHAIKDTLPQAQITLLASPVGAQAGRLNVDIDEVMVYEAPWMDPWRTLPQDPERELSIIAEIQSRNFDGAIIFGSFRQSPLPAAYLCYLAGIPLRVAASIDGPGSLLTTRHRHPDRMMHEVERGLDLVDSIGLTTADRRLVLTVPEEARRRGNRIVRELRRGLGPVAVVHPGCTMPARTYPWEMFAEVCDLLVEDLDATVLLTGVENERELAGRIMSRMRNPAVNLAGEVDFPDFCGLIQAVDLTVTNNTGPMHMSAAVGTPVVALFALTNPPEQWGPWGVSHRQLYHEVPCRLCYSRVCPFNQECLTLVTPDIVVSSARDLLIEAQDAIPRAAGEASR